MLVKNIRTGVQSELREGLARALIARGTVVEVKQEKPTYKKNETKKESDTEVSQKQSYKTRDLKAEAE